MNYYLRPRSEDLVIKIFSGPDDVTRGLIEVSSATAVSVDGPADDVVRRDIPRRFATQIGFL